MVTKSPTILYLNRIENYLNEVETATQTDIINECMIPFGLVKTALRYLESKNIVVELIGVGSVPLWRLRRENE